MAGRHKKVGVTPAEQDLPFHVARHRRTAPVATHGPWATHGPNCKCNTCR